MMNGGLLSLVAIGAQDRLLMGHVHPKIEELENRAGPVACIIREFITNSSNIKGILNDIKIIQRNNNVSWDKAALLLIDSNK